MKKKRGFTLIELLAVIVILAIIAIIAIPIILNMIEESRKGAARDTAYGYIDSIEYTIGFSDINANGYENVELPDNDDDKEFYTVSEVNEQNVKYRGKGPESGVVTITKRKVSRASLCIGKYKVDYNGKEVIKVEKADNCKVDSFDVEDIEVVVNDEHPCELATETKDNKEYYYIDSAEDLYKFSESVNAGNDYSGKIVQLRNNIDLSEYTSDKKTKVCTDNDNISGFTPIGLSSVFSGTFNGNGKIISNLIINRPDNDNVGLFGNSNRASIYGFVADNFNIKGHNFVSAITGQGNYGEYYDIVVRNSHIEGNNAVGVVVGSYYYSNGGVGSIISENNTIKGNQSVASITGYNSSSSGVSLNNTIECNSSCNIVDTGSNAFYSNGTKINNETKSDGFTEESGKDINFYEAIGFDTWIGGDDNNNGVYFDYDKSGKIVLRSTIDNPLPESIDTVLEKSGDYYLIKNEKDWKQAVVFSDGTSKFKLTNNLDFKKNKFYMMGSSYNVFKGNFNGNAKTINNVTINASKANNVGIFGHTHGATVFGFTVDKVKVVGNNYIGAVLGQCNYGDTYEIVVNNSNIEGNNFVGGLIGGYTYTNGGISNNIVENTAIKGNEHISSLHGSNSYSLSNVSLKNNIQCNSSCEVITGENVLYDNNTVLNGTRKTDGFTDFDGKDINFYEALGFDTWIGGENNNSGIYYDYNNSGNIVLYNTSDKPIPNNIDDVLEKSGDFYLIKNANDWKNATVFAAKGKKFKLDESIDFENNKFYMLGSGYNVYNGVLDGGAKVISNVTINASKVNSVGVIGFSNHGTVYGLNLSNIKVKGNVYVGALIGHGNYTDAYEIALYKVNIDGAEGVGGIIGGYSYSWGGIGNIVVKDSVFKANKSVSTIFASYGISSVIVEDADITCTSNTNCQIVNGDNTYYSNKVKLNGETQTNGFDSSNIDNLNYYKGKVETMYNGDQNNTGYFFDYIGDKVFVVKAYTTTNGSTSSTAVVTHTNSSGSDTTAPTCTLNHVIVINNGFEYSFSCTDETEIDKITSLFDHDPYNGQYDSSSFNTIGTIKNGTISNSNKTSSYTSRWTTANSNPPSKGTCYYFSFGGKDASGNYSVYHTDNCYQY